MAYFKSFSCFPSPSPTITLLNFIFPAEECAAGFQLTKEGSCDPCMRGYYRPKGAPACIKCPRTKTTPSISAKSQDECSEGMSICLKNSFIQTLFYLAQILKKEKKIVC